ncbi:MAG: ASCH domain-containing protein [Terriglobia bacterium]
MLADRSLRSFRSSMLHCSGTGMVFTKRLREGVRRGVITCSVRIWKGPHVKVRGRYGMEEGEVEIDSIEQIAIQDITHQLAIESGFLGGIDLLKVAKHGPGDNVYLIRFHYVPPRSRKPVPR